MIYDAIDYLQKEPSLTPENVRFVNQRSQPLDQREFISNPLGGTNDIYRTW